MGKTGEKVATKKGRNTKGEGSASPFFIKKDVWSDTSIIAIAFDIQHLLTIIIIAHTYNICKKNFFYSFFKKDFFIFYHIILLEIVSII